MKNKTCSGSKIESLNSDYIFCMHDVCPEGEYYEDVVPDTLDLAQRASLAINALTNFRPDDYYAITQSFNFGTQPPSLGGANWMTSKFIRALPLMRTMCGSKQNIEAECKAVQTLFKQTKKDGQIYCPISADGPPSGTSYPVLNGVAVLAMLNYHQICDNEIWMEWSRLAAEGLKAASILADDYAYIPPECSLGQDGKWHWTLRGAGDKPGYIPYIPTNEPIHDSQGQEGSVKWEQSNVIKALVHCFEKLHDKEALLQAERLANFCLKPSLWKETTEEDSTSSNEHGQFTGHFHGNMNSLVALLSLALVKNDDKLKQIVREGYENARHNGVIMLGYMPGWIKPLMGRPREFMLESNEGCGIADTLILAAMLTDAGMGDYWDDIDCIVRNHFAELQITELDKMRKASASNGDHDETLERFLGGFTQASLTTNQNSAIYGCCTANGSRALYYAWDGITRFNDGIASVNLFLNRASPWLDIDSYLPYEGKVVFRNKTAETLIVHIPAWLPLQTLECKINGDKGIFRKVGKYIVIDSLKESDTICLQFDIPEHTDSYTIGTTTYKVDFRGSTVVEISPRINGTVQNENKYQFFTRECLKDNKTPMHKVLRFVTDKIIRPY